MERWGGNNAVVEWTMCALGVAKEAVYAQKGKFLPLVQSNAIPTRQLTASVLAPTLNVPIQTINPFDLYTSQELVSYTFDVWRQNRRAVESLQALSDNQRFQVEAGYLPLTSHVAV